MPSEYLSAFIDRLPGMDDETLLQTMRRMKIAAQQYEPEAIAAVEAEVARRGLPPVQQREAARRLAQDLVESCQQDAERLVLEGRSEAHILAWLKARGLDEGAAAVIVRRALDMPAEQQERAGRRNMIGGAAISLVGAAATAASYFLSATSEGNSTVVFTWGLMLVGILQFVRGARQSARSRPTIDVPAETCVEWTEAGEVRSVTFDTAGFGVVKRAPGRTEWRDLAEDTIVAAVEQQADAAPPALDIEALRTGYRSETAERGGGIVSVDVVRAGAVAAARVVGKFRDGLACIYEGTLMAPLRNARFTVTLRARERGVTGTREAVTVSHLLRLGLLRLPLADGPSIPGPRRVDDLLLDPYDPAHDGSALCSLDDDERLDELFADHPLSKVRRWLRTVADTLEIDEANRTVPALDVPTSQPESRVSKRVPPAAIGILYLEAGRMATAEALFAEAVSLDAGEPEGQGLEAAQHLTLLGLAREGQGKFAEAEWAMTRAHRMFQAEGGDADIRTVTALSHRARVLVSLDRFAEAGPLFEQALPVLEERGASGHAAVALNGLGLVRAAAGQHRDAIALFERALQRFEQAEKEQGRPIPDRATVLNNQANALEAVGDKSGATAARARAAAFSPARG